MKKTIRAKESVKCIDWVKYYSMVW